MSKIQQLDLNTINQIAAGEVVENPDSIVKELVENSIDAEATEIEITIEQGGKKLIQISDNGCGMIVDDMKKCYLKHTTSKIIKIEDLNSLKTMGFRGEALASISSVAKLEIKSKVKDEEYGYSVKVENSTVVEEGVCAYRDSGTTITVKDVFYNIPARKSFMETNKDSKLTKHILELVQKLALSHPHIRFKLVSDNDFTLFETNGNGDVKQILSKMYGTDLAKKLIYFESEIYNTTLKGYFCKPEDCVGNKTKQIFFVNGRYVKMEDLSTGLKLAYKDYAVSTKHPVAILFITVNEEDIDVNSHPRKLEVRFKHAILPVILNGIKNEISKHLTFPTISGNTTSTYENEYSQPRVPYINTRGDLRPSMGALGGNSGSGSQRDYNPFPSSPRTNGGSSTAVYDRPTAPTSNVKVTQINPFSLNTDTPAINFVATSTNTPIEETVQESLLDTMIDYHNGFTDYQGMQVLTQIHDSYIICQYKEGMIMIDQHAAHERILYEKFSENYSYKNIIQVDLLIPEILTLSSSEFISTKELLPQLSELGFTLEEYGLNTFAIRSYPSILKSHKIRDFAESIINDLLEQKNNTQLEEEVIKKIIMRSCKSAIKANMKLNMLQMENLLNDLVKCHNPYHCPHGRPIMVNYTMYEIEKSFNRIV